MMNEVDMKKMKFIKILSWTAAHLSWLTMAFSPVAFGKEAENQKTLQFKKDIQSLGLNSKSTVIDFWGKAKAYIPGYAYSGFDSFVEANAQKQMPVFEVKATKNTSGEEVPTLYFTENGKSYTIQFLGEADKYIKINNQLYTESEALNPQKLMTKLIESDNKLTAEYSKAIEKHNYEVQDNQDRPFKNFTGLPRFNKQLWTAMTTTQRAAYIVEMRLLNEKAMLVKEAQSESAKKNKKSSSFDFLQKCNDKYSVVWEFLLGESAVAAPNLTGEHCLNQGFIADSSAAYNNKTSNYRKDKKGNSVNVEACNLSTILESPTYKSNPIVQKAIKDCGNRMPCNPLVYSFKSDGAAFCADAQNESSYQSGTHYNGSCDANARLSSGFVAAKDLRTKDEQGKGNNLGKDLTKLNRDEIKKLNEEGQAIPNEQNESFVATQNYLAGMLLARQLSKDNADPLLGVEKGKELQKQLIGKVWSQELEDELLGIQTAFDENIKKSMDLCSVDLNDKTKKHEDNYRDACEQLHRRWLFSQKIIDQLKCKDGSSPIPDPKTNPKEKRACASPPVPAVVVEPAKPACPEGSSEVKDPKQCQCKGNDFKFPMGEAKLPEACNKKVDPPTPDKGCEYKDVKGVDAKTCKCEGKDTGPVREEPGFFSKMFNKDKKAEYECSGGTNWWLIGGLALGAVALLALLFKNKKKDTQCSNGGTPPECKVTSACLNGGTTPNCQIATTCINGGTPPACSIPTRCANGGVLPECRLPTVCANGGTPPLCQVVSTCSNGGVPPLCQVVSTCTNTCTSPSQINPNTCTCSAPPVEGGSGTNTCAHPPCSGGVPGTGQ